MGLFHFLGKIVGGAAKLAGGIAKAGASELTGGLSDVALSKLKSKGNAKLLAAAGMTDSPKAKTLQTTAYLNKRLVVPPVDSPPPKASIVGSALQIARRKSAQFQQAAEEGEALRAVGLGAYATDRKPVARKARLETARMLDLRAMSRAWVAAGKPEPWQQWIKDFPLYTTAGKLTKVVR